MMIWGILVLENNSISKENARETMGYGENGDYCCQN